MRSLANQYLRIASATLLTTSMLLAYSSAPAYAATDTKTEEHPIKFEITRTSKHDDGIYLRDTLNYTIAYTNNTKKNLTIWPTASNLNNVTPSGNYGGCRWRNLHPGQTATCTLGIHTIDNNDIANKEFTPTVTWNITEDSGGTQILKTETTKGETVKNFKTTERPDEATIPKIRKDNEPVRLAKAGQSVEGKSVACYRIPAIAEAPNGWILASYDLRPAHCGDSPQANSIVQRISKNGGKSFEPMKVIVRGKSEENKYGFSDPSYVVDQETGEIFLFSVKSYDQGWGGSEPGVDPTQRNVLHASVVSSKDNGLTWSEPRIITKDITTDTQNWKSRFAASGHGIQLKYGKYKGRLIQQYTINNNGKHQAVSVYSDDHGKTWRAGKPIGYGANQHNMDENKVVELSDGSVMLNSRPLGQHYRLVTISHDGGETYGPVKLETNLPDPANNAQITRAYPDAPMGSEAAKVLLYSSSSANGRQNGLIRVSYDDGNTWTSGKQFNKGAMSYSCIQALSTRAGGGYGLLYEAANNDIMYSRLSADWLELKPVTTTGTINLPQNTKQFTIPINNPTSNTYKNVRITNAPNAALNGVNVSSKPVTLEAGKVTYIPVSLKVSTTLKSNETLRIPVHIGNDTPDITSMARNVALLTLPDDNALSTDALNADDTNGPTYSTNTTITIQFKNVKESGTQTDDSNKPKTKDQSSQTEQSKKGNLSSQTEQSKKGNLSSQTEQETKPHKNDNSNKQNKVSLPQFPLQPAKTRKHNALLARTGTNIATVLLSIIVLAIPAILLKLKRKDH